MFSSLKGLSYNSIVTLKNLNNTKTSYLEKQNGFYIQLWLLKFLILVCFDMIGEYDELS